MKKITETDLGIWVIAIIPAIVTYITTIKYITMNINISPHIPFISAIFVLLLVIMILYVRRWILIQLRKLNELKYLRIKLKYYDIMLTKFSANNSSHPYHIFDKDTILFSEDEKYILNDYLKSLESLKTIMKGKNLI